MTPGIKVSIITVCFNAGITLKRCIASVLDQDYPHIEYLIIDGGSTDDSLSIIAEYKHRIARLVSEPDKGLYDAMNKGLKLATGDVIGTLNADDFFVDGALVSALADAFERSGADIVYGNLNYINPAGRITRKWSAGEYRRGMFNRGWMPPHPTFYARSSLFEKWGNYRLDYGTAADYELMLRFMHRKNVKVFYLNRLFLHMQTGGVSNKTYMNRVKASKSDFKAMQAHKVRFPHIVLLLKPLRKLIQFFK